MSRLIGFLKRLPRGLATLVSSVTGVKLPWVEVTRKTRHEIRSLASEQTVLTPRDCGLILDLDETNVIEVLETGELSGFRVGAHWRVTPTDLHSFIQAKREETRLALLRRTLEDPASWAKVWWEDKENAQRILAEEHAEGTVGRFIQDALRDHPPSPGE